MLGAQFQTNHRLLNDIILIVKHYIYQCKYWIQALSLKSVLSKSNGYYLIEKQIAADNQNHIVKAKFDNKWSTLWDVLQEE